MTEYLNNLSDMLITAFALFALFGIAGLALWLQRVIRRQRRAHWRAMQQEASWPIQQQKPLDVEFWQSRDEYRAIYGIDD